MFGIGMVFTFLTMAQYIGYIPGISGLFPNLMWLSWIIFWFVPKTVVQKYFKKFRKVMNRGSNPPESKK